MWDFASHEVNQEGKDKFGTHKEHIKALMSMDGALQAGYFDLWIDHWLQDHIGRRKVENVIGQQ